MSTDTPPVELLPGTPVDAGARAPIPTMPAFADWKTVLAGERDEPYFRSILASIERERAAGQLIYPSNADMFNALTHTPFAEVRVVILVQDPYHGPNQARGLSFSVQRGVPPPPSLVNIFKELESDLGIPSPSHGCLDTWARRGVLLLNATLSVRAGAPQSHANLGWERFTDRVIQAVNEQRDHVVFMLWGSSAQKKGAMIDRRRHCVLTAPHPSPLSAYRGFLGCRHFSKANEYLRNNGAQEIDWRID